MAAMTAGETIFSLAVQLPVHGRGQLRVGLVDQTNGVHHFVVHCSFPLSEMFLSQKARPRISWVFVKQFSRNDMATACQDWLRVPG